jgi:hypothetical protein
VKHYSHHHWITRGLLAGLLLINGELRAADLPSLKEVYQNHFYVGAAINRSMALGTGVRADNVNRDLEQLGLDLALLKAQFNQISPENDLKWALIHPREGTDGYNFGPADAYVDFGSSNGMYLVGHTLVWHGQTPMWVFQGTNPPPAETTSPAPAPGATNAPGAFRRRGPGGNFGYNGRALRGKSCCNGCAIISTPWWAATRAGSKSGMWSMKPWPTAARIS